MLPLAWRLERVDYGRKNEVVTDLNGLSVFGVHALIKAVLAKHFGLESGWLVHSKTRLLKVEVRRLDSELEESLLLLVLLCLQRLRGLAGEGRGSLLPLSLLPLIGLTLVGLDNLVLLALLHDFLLF